MENIVITLSEDGDVRFLVNDTTACLLEDNSVVRRASHVDPDSYILRIAFHALRAMFGEKGLVGEFTRKWPCAWRVDLSPSNGPLLDEVFYSRQDAIEAEVEWLNANFI